MEARARICTAISGDRNVQVQQSSQKLAAVVGDSNLLLHILSNLTSRDALSVALASKAAKQALQTHLQHHTIAAFPLLSSICCPSIVIVASGASKLLKVCLTHDGCWYNSTKPITRVTGRAAVKRNKASRPGPAGWLTGVAVNPDDGQLYVCDYRAKGIIRYSSNLLSRQRKFASSSAALSTPEGIAFAAGTCYVACIANNSVVALGSTGRVKQVAQLIEGFVPWGMTAWEQPGTRPEGSALFVAVDVEYVSANYTVPPETVTGGVLCLKLSASGEMLGPPFIYSRVNMKRPSGLTFDHEGHLWVTSAQQQLLRLAGPQHTTPGVLLQTLNLPDLLPEPARSLFPFDVQAILKSPDTSLAAAAAAGGGLGLTQLVVTLHRGSKQAGAVAVLELKGTNALEFKSCVSGEKQQGGLCNQASLAVTAAVAAAAPAVPAAAAKQMATASSGAEQMCVRLVGYMSDHPALQEPNMIAVLQ